MISQSLYYALCMASSVATRHFHKIQEEWLRFYKPYVLVIHLPTRCGFYLDREYRHIIDVTCCREPENPVEVERNHLCASSNLPAWIGEVGIGYPSDQFDTFWLY